MYRLRKFLLVGSMIAVYVLFSIFSIADEYFGEKVESSSSEPESFPVHSGNIPVVEITTKSGSLSYIESDKENFESGFITILSEDGNPVYYGQLDKMKGRGNTSWEVPKKSYSLKLDSGASLLGMEKAKRWILTADYYDGAYIRNSLGFWLADRAGLKYVADSRFVDLYVNGEYHGLYELMERIELGEGRIPITDGWLLEMDYPERAIYEENVLYLENGQPVVIHEPGKVSDSEMDSLKSWFLEMEKALYADDYVNPDTGKEIFEYLDLESFARKYLLEEVFLNMDMGVTSHYLYMDESGKLYEGPPWDLDNTMGRGSYAEDELLLLQGDPSRNQMLRWYIRLCGNDTFYEAVLRVWEDNMYPALQEMEDAADELLEPLKASIQMDQERWPGSHSMAMPNTDLDYNVSFLKEYLSKRTEFLYQAFTVNPQKTKERLQERMEEMPEEAVIEPYEEEMEETVSFGVKEYLFAGHGMIALFLLLMVMILLIAVDRRRNG